MLDRTRAVWDKQHQMGGDRLDIFTSVADAIDAHDVLYAGSYGDELDLADGSFDLLVSLYAGFISEHCTRYVCPGGFLLVNPSHGDAAMASIDDRYSLHGVIEVDDDGARVSTEELDTHLVAKRPVDVTAELLHASGKAVADTRSPWAYLFQRVASTFLSRGGLDSSLVLHLHFAMGAS
jgi:hypothetical protein